MDKYKVDIVDSLTASEFKRNYLKLGRPVLIKGAIKHWQATQGWGTRYFKQYFPDQQVPVKRFEKGNIIKEAMPLGDYCDQLDAYERGEGEFPAYCHDIPIFHALPELKQDINDFPSNFMPIAYSNWWKYCQFFLGPSQSVTPLHFDCLLTHNLFFQIKGTKRFTLLPYEDSRHCGRYGWRWFKLDPEQPDLQQYAQYDKDKAVVVDVEAGDILFMPSGTLHHVRSMDTCVSFNIDFHNQHSAWRGVKALYEGIPVTNFYYNFLCLLRLMKLLPERVFFRLYKGYLNYVS